MHDDETLNTIVTNQLAATRRDHGDDRPFEVRQRARIMMLAQSVLVRAMRDVRNPKDKIRRDALRFLFCDECMDYWCTLATIGDREYTADGLKGERRRQAMGMIPPNHQWRYEKPRPCHEH